MPLAEIDLDHAREKLAHRIAACVHMMLAEANWTVGELKSHIAKFPAGPLQTTPEMIDAILTATRSDIVTIGALADIAFALRFEWNFKIVRLNDTPVEVPFEDTANS